MNSMPASQRTYSDEELETARRLFGITDPAALHVAVSNVGEFVDTLERLSVERGTDETGDLEPVMAEQLRKR